MIKDVIIPGTVVFFPGDMNSRPNRRVFIFGAGCSVFAGFPLGRGLWPFLLDHLERTLQGTESNEIEWIEAYLTSLPDEQAAREVEDFEGLLTRAVTDGLRLGECHPDPAKRPDWRTVRRFFRPYRHLLRTERSRRDYKKNLRRYYIGKLKYWASLPRITKPTSPFWSDPDDFMHGIEALIADAFILHHACILRRGGHFARVAEYPFYAHACPCFLRFNLSNHHILIRRLVRTIVPGDTIITFNYDSLIESVLWRAGKWTPLDGYGFVVNFHPVRINKLGGRHSRALSSSPVTVLKAHGSINWLKNHEDQTVGLNYLNLLFDLPIWTSYVADQDRFIRSPFADIDTLASQGANWPHTEQVILSPTYKKDYESDQVYSEIWKKIDESLQGASEITVLGYSLPPGDEDARCRIGAALRQNNECREITVVSPGDTHWNTSLKETGMGCKPIRMRLEQWLEPPRTGAASARNENHAR